MVSGGIRINQKPIYTGTAPDNVVVELDSCE